MKTRSKKCKNCRQIFKVRLKDTSSQHANVHRIYCYECDGSKIWYRTHRARTRFLQRRWVKQNPEKALARYRRRHLHKHGFTEKVFRELQKSQKNRCAICKKKFTRSIKPNGDHKHGTKLHRGLLCSHCNWLLGNAKDDIIILKAAIKYLRRWA